IGVEAENLPARADRERGRRRIHSADRRGEELIVREDRGGRGRCGETAAGEDNGWWCARGVAVAWISDIDAEDLTVAGATDRGSNDAASGAACERHGQRARVARAIAGHADV